MIEPLITALKIDKFDFDSVNVAFDIGSRDGMQALELAEIFPNAKIFAIECNPDTLPLLKDNINSNSRIELIDIAISDSSGNVVFNKIDKNTTITPHLDGNPGASSLFLANGDYPFEKYSQIPISIAAMTLDDICNKYSISCIDVIWMDLQGAELKAFRGFEKHIKLTKYIFVELTHKEIYRDQPLFTEVDKYLSNLNFERVTAIDSSLYFEDVIYRNKAFFNPIKPYVVIEQTWGGLGDNLALSTLPQSFSKVGINCYISSNNVTRNNEIRDLVWSDNPFVLGVLNEETNYGQRLIESKMETTSHHMPYFSRIEETQGLYDFSDSPLVYKKPRLIQSLVGKVLIDISSTSVAHKPDVIKRYVEQTINCYKYNIRDVVQIKFLNYLPKNNLVFNDIPVIECIDLLEYWSVLYSISTLITVHSGVQTLSIAAKNLTDSKLKSIHCLATPFQFNSRMYIYDSVNYFVE